MASKTPRTMIGEYMNASDTQTTKTSRVQSRVTETPESPRFPSWVQTSQGKSPFASKRKSPGKPLVHNRVSSLQAKRKNVSLNEEVTPRTLVCIVNHRKLY